ncbi:MAG TPA: DUF4214 domain-containing protein [Iamia sp.]|nr:DUF4214 domain-containing protein [Iamia sp.]
MQNTTTTPSPRPSRPALRRLVASVVGATVALTGLGLAASPASAAPPGPTNIVSNLGYDVPGPTGHHRLGWAPDLDGETATAYQVERWNAAKTEKLFTDNQAGSVESTVTFKGMPDGVVFQYRVRSKTAQGWGPFGDFEPIKVTPNVTHHRPFGTELDLVERQMQDFFGITTGASTWLSEIDDADDVAFFLDHLWVNSQRANRHKVVRLYLAYFDRAPGPAGLDYWTDRLDTGASTLSHVSAAFAASNEFQDTYGGLTNQQFVTLVYQNVLFRNPAPNEVAYWKGQLDQGLTTRGKVMIGFSESPEGKALRSEDVVVADLWATMIREPASEALMDAYGPHLGGGGTPGSLALMLLPLNDYSAYFA